MTILLSLCLDLLGFSDYTFTVHLVFLLKLVRAITIGSPLGCRVSACMEVMTMEAPRLFGGM